MKLVRFSAEDKTDTFACIDDGTGEDVFPQAFTAELQGMRPGLKASIEALELSADEVAEIRRTWNEWDRLPGLGDLIAWKLLGIIVVILPKE